MSIKITIIIVTYNAEKELEGAILSVLNQNYKNKELLIIDGESKDGTVDIIKKYSNSIDFWSSETDDGIYDAMNKGWQHANGDYILYLGSDDRLLEGALSALSNNAQNADIVYGDVKCRHKNDVIKEKYALAPSIIRKHPFCSHQSLMMKRSLIAELGGFNCEYKILADYDLILRACQNGASLQYVHYFISLFNMGGASGFTYKSDKEKLRIHKRNSSVTFPYLLFFINIAKKSMQILKERFL